MLDAFSLTFVSIFVAMDIVGTLPLFMSMTRRLSSEGRRQIVDNSMLVAVGVAILFLFVGNGIFRFLGITLFDFKIAGGLVLLLVALADLVGGPEATKQSSGSTGVVPLAVPLITGPGVITSMTLQVSNAGYSVTFFALFLNYLLAWGILRNSESVTRVIGKDGTVVISKVAALLLSAIAVAMIRSGVFEAIAAFKLGRVEF
jgi:multiple antibiotic resistance protein